MRELHCLCSRNMHGWWLNDGQRRGARHAQRGRVPYAGALAGECGLRDPNRGAGHGRRGPTYPQLVHRCGRRPVCDPKIPDYHQGHGLANKFHDVPMPAGASFRIGSNSKLFVAVALYQMQEKGMLSISDLVFDHLDATDFANFGKPKVTTWCPKVWNTTTADCTSPTIEDLLSMGSGIIDVTSCAYPADSPLKKYCYGMVEDIFDQTPPYSQDTMQLVDGLYSGDLGNVVGGFIMHPLSDKPGTVYHYTNSNFVLATYLVEKYAKMGFGQYLKENVLGPLKLHNTHIDNYGPQYSVSKYPLLPEEYYEYYDNRTGAYIDAGKVALELSPGAITGAGGVFSTSADMHTWYASLFSLLRGKRRTPVPGPHPGQREGDHAPSHGGAAGLVLRPGHGRAAVQRRHRVAAGHSLRGRDLQHVHADHLRAAA